MKHLHADLAVIGAGSGGLSVASGAAQLGLRVVLFERGEMGGDCLNFGCVPSKALISAAKAAHDAATSAAIGVDARPQVDFSRVMDHVHAVIAGIAPHDSQERFEGLGVVVIRQSAAFVGPRTVEGDDVRVTARKIVVATGSRPRAPSIEGLDNVPYLTNETVFSLTAAPRRLVILGAGPIGLELGQAFRRLGSEVVVIEQGQALMREDREMAADVLDQIARDGVEVLEGAAVSRIGRRPDGVELSVTQNGRQIEIEGSHLLVAAGRAPNLEDLNLEAAGVRFDARGIVTDRRLRSVSNRAVFAVGDVAGRGAFTHVAGAQASLVIRKALFAQPIDADALIAPRVTYTDPEIAGVGLTEGEAIERHGEGVRIVRSRFADNDRARAEADTRGGAKLILDRRGRLLGASIVGRQAGDLIQPWVLAMTAGLKVRDMTAVVAPYPTRGEINKRVAGEVFTPLLFSKATRRLVRILKHLG
ncbi:MAG: dihydrolipoamide dehydrogenase [Phenylobacterium sp.]|uniref:dihydrolipoyl dehydrogenase family protein n=1 Tax=Phenylobacterium sp. TaxID=1871053 RepID=UPI0025FDC70C|nr:FAD-dependent oxidoreductase [Phenylobacterium sp.]MBI1196245.1 dihydrolipoamide dehydrogenase [Phenylobacterium sp.]